MTAAFDKRVAFVAMAVNAGLSDVLTANDWYILNKPMLKVPNEKVLEHFRDALEMHRALASTPTYDVGPYE